MGFGTFDGLHPGHISYLKQLKKLGEPVGVVVARDENVSRIKGKPPQNDEITRLTELQQSGLVDLAVLGHMTDFYQSITDHNPEIIGLGYDQHADVELIQKLFPDVKIVRLESFEPDIHKSSLRNQL